MATNTLTTDFLTVPAFVPTTSSPPPLPIPNAEHRTTSTATDTITKIPAPPRTMFAGESSSLCHPLPSRSRGITQSQMGFSLTEYKGGANVDSGAGTFQHIEHSEQQEADIKTALPEIQVDPHVARGKGNFKNLRVPVPTFKFNSNGEIVSARLVNTDLSSPGPWPVTARSIGSDSDFWGIRGDDLV
ncbi:hypothetical protein NM688_g8693 [Phlebia brevispora]|uniref:Uncharacterized protein n=1 Tax=Phlebia brevispora TaxID=194682 RepID=A0ACC1RQ47_9APHY|nr:hypothetical protein NM688_g8693 [Phlebia brevispora]